MSEMEWGKPEDGWRLSLSLDKTEFQAGEPVLATVVFQNCGKGKQTFGIHGEDFDYYFHCLHESGSQAPFTQYGTLIKKNARRTKYASPTIGPGEESVKEILLSRHVDISWGGKYTVSVSRRVFPTREGDANPNVVSNECTFEVLD